MSNEKGKANRQLLCNYLLALNVDLREYRKYCNTVLDNSIFSLPNQAAFYYITYFLFGKLDIAKRTERFRVIWPLNTRKDESEFRRVTFSWLTNLSQENQDARIPKFAMSLFMTPSGDKLCSVYIAFARFTLQKVLFRKFNHTYFLQVVVANETRVAAVAYQSAVFQNLVADYNYVQNITIIRETKIAECATALERINCQLKEDINSVQISLQEVSSEIAEQYNSCDEIEKSCTMLAESTRSFWNQLQPIHVNMLSGKQVIQDVTNSSKRVSVNGYTYSVKAPLTLINTIRSKLEKANLFRIHENGKLNLENLIKLFTITLSTLEKPIKDLAKGLDIEKPTCTLQLKNLEEKLSIAEQSAFKVESEDLETLCKGLVEQETTVEGLKPFFASCNRKLQAATPCVTHVHSSIVATNECHSLMNVSSMTWLDTSMSDNIPSPDLCRRALERALSSNTPQNRVKPLTKIGPSKIIKAPHLIHRDNTFKSKLAECLPQSEKEDFFEGQLKDGVHLDETPSTASKMESPKQLEDLVFSPILNRSLSSRLSIGDFNVSLLDAQTFPDCPSFDISTELNASKLLFDNL